MDTFLHVLSLGLELALSLAAVVWKAACGFFGPEVQAIRDLEALPRLFFAALSGAIIGLEREHAHKPAGLRTNTMVAVGSCLFTLTSVYCWKFVDPTSDPSRIAAQIASGIGFLGAGLIFKNENTVTGITTAASIWVCAATGMVVGFGLPLLGVIVAACTACFLYFVGHPLQKLDLSE